MGIAPTLRQTSISAPGGGRTIAKVVGIFDTGVTPVDYGRTYMLLNNAQTLLNKKNVINEIVIRLGDYTRAREVAEHLQKRGQVARTVTTKLRYADFSIRSRSTSLDIGIDDAEQIADLACRLLDRGLRDRPGALRLVGVGVSGLAGYRQLVLETS